MIDEEGGEGGDADHNFDGRRRNRQCARLPASMSLVAQQAGSDDAQLLPTEASRRLMLVAPCRAFVVATPILVTLIVFVVAPHWYGTDLYERLEPPACELYASLTFFIVCVLMVLVSEKLARPFFFEPLFPATWSEMKAPVQVQAVADLLKICTRLACFAFATPLWTRFSFNKGLDLGTLDSCLDTDDIVLRRCFNGMRYMLAATMMWDTCAAQKMSWDIYLHHVVLIIGGVVLPDPFITQGWMDADEASILVTEGFGFVLFFGATFIFVKECFVLCYRCAPSTQFLTKAQYLKWAEAAHLTQAVPMFVILPLIFLSFIAAGQENHGLAATQHVLLWLIFVGLNALEAFIAFQTTSVRRHLLKKAAEADRREAVAGGVSMNGAVAKSIESTKAHD